MEKEPPRPGQGAPRMDKAEQYAVAPEVALEFLSRTLPFSELDAASLGRLARACVIDFAPRGTRIFVQGVTGVDCLRLVQKGGVRVFIRHEDGEETLLDHRSEGESIGALALFRDGRASMNVETVEDTFFFRLEKDAFLAEVARHPALAQYYLKTFSHDYVAKAFAGLRKPREDAVCTESGLYLFSTKVGGLVHRAPVTVPMGSTVQDAAMTMHNEQVGSLLITDPSGEISGIVTDKDLRKAVALGMDSQAGIEALMSTPVVAVQSGEVCFDALFRMMSAQIHHLAVEEQGRIVGLVTSHDIMVMQGKSPMAIFREIKAQRSIAGLYPLPAKAAQVVRTLVEEGAKAGAITRMIAVLNDMILERLMELLLAEMGPPPVPFCWLLMGSEGRREQTFATDQDNALVYRDCHDEVLCRAAQYYFTAFAEKATEHLIQCGYPPCPGGIMASTDQWRQPFAAWRDTFERWIDVPEPQELRFATIFFDFRAGFGDLDLADTLRNHVARHAGRQEVFLRHMAADCLRSRPPLSFFRGFIVEKDGEHRNTLDIKQRGLMPVVDFARIMALKHGFKETNTMDRLDQLGQGELVSRDLYADLKEAYEFMMQLRIVHQLGQVEQGLAPDNRIAPDTLSELEKRTLKDAFAAIGRMQSAVREIFRMELG